MNIRVNPNVIGQVLKVHRQKFSIFSFIFLLLFGADFVGAGLFILKESQIAPNWIHVTGKVVDASRHISDGSIVYTPVVQYEVNGQNYRVTTNSSSGSYPTIGEKRAIAYNPNQPGQAKVLDDVISQTFLWLSLVIGIGLLILAPILFLKSFKRSNEIKRLIQTGQKVQGILVDIQSSKNSYKIVVSATDNTGIVQNYISDSLNGIAGLVMADYHKNPIPIDVYIDLRNPQNYYVDIADIPNLTPERINELIRSARKNPLKDSNEPGSK